MTSIYQEIILDHYKHPHNWGTVTDATNQTTISNSSCGDKFDLSGVIKNGVLKECSFEGEGCAISTASASLLIEYAKGKKINALKKLDASFILKLVGIELSPNRLKCALLPLEGLQKLLSSSRIPI